MNHCSQAHSQQYPKNAIVKPLLKKETTTTNKQRNKQTKTPSLDPDNLKTSDLFQSCLSFLGCWRRLSCLSYLIIWTQRNFGRGFNAPIVLVTLLKLLYLRIMNGPLTCSNGGQVSLPISRSGELQMQKLKSLPISTLSLKVLPLKPGVGQYIAMHAILTARDFFLANFYLSGPFTCIFSKTSPEFFLC